MGFLIGPVVSYIMLNTVVVEQQTTVLEYIIAIVIYAIIVAIIGFVIIRKMEKASEKRMQVGLEQWDADVAKIFKDANIK